MTARDIISHEITHGDLHVTLSDGSRHIATFAGCVSASDAWDDIDGSGYTFESAEEEYDFSPATNQPQRKQDMPSVSISNVPQQVTPITNWAREFARLIAHEPQSITRVGTGTEGGGENHVLFEATLEDHTGVSKTLLAVFEDGEVAQVDEEWRNPAPPATPRMKQAREFARKIADEFESIENLGEGSGGGLKYVLLEATLKDRTAVSDVLLAVFDNGEVAQVDESWRN